MFLDGCSYIFIILITIHIPLNGRSMYIYVGIIGFFEQSIKKTPQNPQVPTYIVRSHNQFTNTIGFCVIISSEPCATTYRFNN